MYVVATKPTPVFNTDNLEKVFWDPASFDDKFLLRQLEVVLYPNSLFEVVSDRGDLFEVRTDEYIPTSTFFIHKHFVQKTNTPKKREKKMPTREEIIRRLETFPNCMYIWGANVPEGIPDLFKLYPPKRPLTPFESTYLQFKGVDCSGLLYHVTDGCTPRNTRDLMTFGEQVSHVKPLDIIVWPGHVLIALPGERLIECRIFDGLVLSPQNDRLKQLEDKPYHIIRWC